MHATGTTLESNSLALTRHRYLEKSYYRLNITPTDWRPEAGFRANRHILEPLYLYYQAIYRECPDALLWAGLARLTGGQVLFGLGNAVKIARDPCGLTQGIVAVAKAIFENLAWQHELFLADEALLRSVCKEMDQSGTACYPYAEAWALIGSGEYDKICLGNRMLLKNEQRDTIQPHYEAIRRDRYANRYFRWTRFAMRNIHPHHRRFIFDFPFGDVTRFEDRWRWIDHPRGMWASWVGLSKGERDRLVGLSNEAVVRHEW